MAPQPSDDERDNPRPRWVAWAIGLLAAAIALGMANLAWMMLTGRLGPTAEKSAAAAAGAPSASSAAVRPSIPSTASSCMRCHGVDRTYVGPAFASIATRYRDRADAQAYLAGKIRNGSVGEWGRVVMPRQVGVTDATALELAAWILQLAPPAESAAHRGKPPPADDDTVK